jgi:hypothetical protein
MSRKSGLFVADGEYRTIPKKMKVKANRANVRMFGMNLTITKSLLPFQMRFNPIFVDILAHVGNW